MTPEHSFVSHTENQERLPIAIPVVRIFPVAPISLEEFSQILDVDPGLSDAPIVKTYLARQSENGGSDLMTPFGGKIPKGRSIHEEALSRLEFDTTMVHHANELTSTFLSDAPPLEPFVHRVPDQQEPRLAYCVVLPVRSASFSAHVLRKNTDRPDKKKDIYGVTPKALRQSFLSGIVNLEDGSEVPILEHLTTVDHSFVPDGKERFKRYLALRDIMHEVERTDDLWKKAIVREVNHTRKFYNMFAGQSLPDAEFPADCTKKELTCGFISAQMRASLYDEHRRDKEGKTTPPKPQDMLKVARVFSVTPPEYLLDVMVNVPTEPSFSGIRAFRKSIRPVVEEIYSQLLHKELPATIDTYTALKTLWPRVLAMSLVDRVSFFDTINDRFIDTFSTYLGMPRTSVELAYRAAQKYPDFIAENLRALGPQFQEYRPMNEVTNAPMVLSLLLGLGFHPDVSLSKNDLRVPSMELLRFESFRTLVLMGTAIEARAKKESIQNTLFRAALNTFLEFPPTVETIDIGNGLSHQVMHRTIEQPIDGVRVHLTVDERAAKSTESIMRKMYQSPTIYDEHMINITLSEDNFSDGATLGDHLALAEKVKEALLLHVESEIAGSGWTLGIVPGTHRKQALERAVSYQFLTKEEKQHHIEQLKTGVRPGSEGDRIIREKFVLLFRHEGQKDQMIEVNLYPVESLSQMPEFDGSGLMGFQEKIVDDATGRYTAERWFVRDAKTPCTPSLYEQLYPPELYEQHLKKIKPYQRKKK